MILALFVICLAIIKSFVIALVLDNNSVVFRSLTISFEFVFSILAW
jgi:hypothetical protein